MNNGLTIATICARGGSKGLPGKNIRLFCGKPLIVHTIEQALACQAINAVYVSTDDAAIAEVALAAGAKVPFLRPAELATDDAAKLPVIEHLVRHIETEGQIISRIVDLQPTSPLRNTKDIVMALQARPNAALTISVNVAGYNPYFNLIENGGDGWAYLCKGTGGARRQDVPIVYAVNGSIYVWQRTALAHAAEHGMWSVNIGIYTMPRWKSVDIDDLEDFEYAEWLAQRHATEWGA
jgi:N-acylneuraminate cytidylyltransferase